MSVLVELEPTNREASFGVVDVQVFFPIQPPENIILLSQADYLMHHPSTLSLIHGCDELVDFILMYADRTRRWVADWTIQNSNALVGYGDRVTFDHKNKTMSVQSSRDNGSTYWKTASGVEGILDVMATYFRINRLLKANRQNNDWQCAQQWYWEIYTPWVMHELDWVRTEAIEHGYHDGFDQAMYVVGQAKAFYDRVGANAGVTIHTHTSDRFYLPGTFLADPALGNVLANAYWEGGTINGKPIENVPWELFPQTGEYD